MSTFTQSHSRRTRKNFVTPMAVSTLLLYLFLLPLGLQQASAEEAPQPPGKLTLLSGSGFEGDAPGFGGYWTEAGDKTGRTSSIDFTTMPGTADESDYRHVSGTIVFDEEGEYQPIDALDLYADNLNEGPEYFYLVFSNPTNGVLVDEGQLVHKIWIHDMALAGNGYLQFWSEHVWVNEGAGTANAGLTRFNAGSLGEDASARYCMCSITAVKGVDFIGAAGTALFPRSEIDPGDGANSYAIPFTIIDDNIPEETETFRIKVSNIKGADPGAFHELIVHIIDND